MPAVLSTMIELGTPCPPFSLPATTGKGVSRDDATGPAGLLVVFMCNHCPYVVHIREELARLGRECAALGVGMVGINSNDADAYPDDSPEKMAEESDAAGYTFSYLFDATQDVARAFSAQCTPDFFLYGADGGLFYRGQLDESRPGSGVEVTGEDLRNAINAMVAGEDSPEDQKPSLGCSIKWKA
jgi:peroxiredoxin